MRRLTAILAISAAALVVSPSGTRGAAAPAAGIAGLLEERARAVLAGDREAFLATVDPRDPSFLRRQGLLFDGFRRLGLESYSLEVGGDLPGLTTAREVARYGAGSEPTVLHVVERYAIEGYDPSPAVEDLYLTFVRGPDGWRVASDTDLDDVTLFSGRKLWEFGPIVTRASDHFLFVSHPDLAPAAGPVLEAAEVALRRAVDAWPLPWPRRVVILAPGDAEELRRLLQATFDLDVFVAFAVSTVERSEDWELRGHRIVLNWPTFSRYPDPLRERILVHELLHIATRGLAGPQVPAFVDEGVAEWGTGDAATGTLAESVRAGTFDRRLPADHEFVSGGDAAIAAAYQESYTAIGFAAEEFGAGAVAEFYRALGAARLVPGTWRYHVGRAMRAAFGVGFAEFERAWAGSVRESYG